MPSKIHTFRAATMDEALDLVRRELGLGAVVVDSREVATRRILPWPSTVQEIEVSVTQAPARNASKPHRPTEPKSAKPGRTIRTLAETMAKTPVARALFAPMPELPAETLEHDRQIEEQLAEPPRWILPSTPATPVRDDRKSDRVESVTPGYQQKLESLEVIVTQLERQSRPPGMHDVPSDLFQSYLKLIAADVDEEAARDLIAKLRRQSSPETLNSPSAITTMLTVLIEREMRCAPPITPQPGRREIITLVGPTGVGKTTTLAKLAGHFQLREGLKVGLITVDSYRVGAVEQLRTYAEILQVPLKATSNPDELRAAIDEMDNVDVVLIDTAGRSPFDRSKLNELRDLIRVTASNHVLLVLSLAAGAKMLSKIADQFASAAPTSLVLTKLDESIGGGGLMAVAREIPHPVSYLTTGQDVPDHLEPAHPSRLARLILGRDQILPDSRQPVSSD